MKVFTRLYLVLFILLPVMMFGQDDDTPVMQYFVGGKMKLGLNMGLNLGGAGIGTSTYGGIISPTVSNGVAGIFSNPAELANLKSTQIHFNTRLPISSGLFGLGTNDILSESTLKETTDEIINQEGTFIFNDGSYREDIKASEAEFGLTGALSSFTIGMNVMDGLSIAIGYYNPLSYSTKFLISGIGMILRTSRTVGNNVTNIDMDLTSSFISEMELDYNQITFGAGYEVYKNESSQLTAGVSVTRYQMRNRLNIGYYTQGSMILSNVNEYYFNNPNDQNLNFDDGETNKLYWNAFGNYKDNKYGVKLAATYAMNFENLFISSAKFTLVYDQIPEMTMTDPNAISESYQPKFITGRFGDDANPVDFVVDSIDLAKPNLTVPAFNVHSDNVIVSVPSSVTFGTDLTFSSFTLSTNIVSYLSEVSYKYDKYKLGIDPSFGFKFGWDIKTADKFENSSILLWPLRLMYLDFDGIILQAFGESTGYRNPHYRMGVGLMFGDAIAEGMGDDMKKDLQDGLSSGMITGFSLGRQ
ncbi:MAG: hypothetical protein K9G44_05455, partial [Melioribacteraceae bacterium]|nr:hypothetical protein [Melioribacteraceae bacterium]